MENDKIGRLVLKEFDKRNNLILFDKELRQDQHLEILQTSTKILEVMVQGLKESKDYESLLFIFQLIALESKATINHVGESLNYIDVDN